MSHKNLKKFSFFDLLEQLADETAIAAVTFCNKKSDARAKQEMIKRIEEKADVVVHAIVLKLDLHDKPPLKGRTEIFRLAHNIDNIIDYVEEASFLILLAKLSFSDDFLTLGELIKDAAEEIQEVLPHFRTIRKKQESVDRITRASIRLNEIEEAGDALFRAMLHQVEAAKITATDGQDMMKWHTFDRIEKVLNTLERALDQCEDVGNFLESMKKENV